MRMDRFRYSCPLALALSFFPLSLLSDNLTCSFGTCFHRPCNPTQGRVDTCKHPDTRTMPGGHPSHFICLLLCSRIPPAHSRPPPSPSLSLNHRYEYVFGSQW